MYCIRFPMHPIADHLNLGNFWSTFVNHQKNFKVSKFDSTHPIKLHFWFWDPEYTWKWGFVLLRNLTFFEGRISLQIKQNMSFQNSQRMQYEHNSIETLKFSAFFLLQKLRNQVINFSGRECVIESLSGIVSSGFMPSGIPLFAICFKTLAWRLLIRTLLNSKISKL